MHKKFKISFPDIVEVVQECCNNNNLHINSETTILQACRVAVGYSFYDSLIISAAIECGCTVLYTEDMQNTQLIDGILTIRNPFQNKN